MNFLIHVSSILQSPQNSLNLKYFDSIRLKIADPPLCFSIKSSFCLLDCFDHH